MPPKNKQPQPTLKDRFQALQYLPPFFKEIWHTQPWMTSGNIGLRLIRSAIPFLTLYVGKLIIDEVVQLINNKPSDTQQLILLVSLELALALGADLLNRATSLLDALLGDLHANRSSIQIMQHAATLDLAQYEEPIFYDKLERARQQTVGRTALLSQTLAQIQDLITIGFLGAGVIFKEENRIVGLTTASTIWTAAALGLCIGVGYWAIALYVAGLVLVVLIFLPAIERWIDYANQNKIYRITRPYHHETLHYYEELFQKYHLKAFSVKQSIVNGDIVGTWNVRGTRNNHKLLVNELLNDANITQFDF